MSPIQYSTSDWRISVETTFCWPMQFYHQSKQKHVLCLITAVWVFECEFDTLTLHNFGSVAYETFKGMIAILSTAVKTKSSKWHFGHFQTQPNSQKLFFNACIYRANYSNKKSSDIFFWYAADKVINLNMKWR